MICLWKARSDVTALSCGRLWKLRGVSGLELREKNPAQAKLGRGTLTLTLTLSALKADGETDLPETTSFFGGLC